jgi:hypothetical protein
MPSSTPQRQWIELIFDDDCPNVGPARQLLGGVLDELGLPQQWCEWNREAPDTPPELRVFGSPTILVDGVDVAEPEFDEPNAFASSRCRLYEDEAGRRSGIPRRQDIVRALLGSKSLQEIRREPSAERDRRLAEYLYTMQTRWRGGM